MYGDGRETLRTVPRKMGEHVWYISVLLNNTS